MTPIILPPLATIKARALEALNAGRLQCQQPDFQARLTPCFYSAPCALGATLSPEDAAACDTVRPDGTGSITYLIANGVVAIHPDDDFDATLSKLAAIQRTHDERNLSGLRTLLESP